MTSYIDLSGLKNIHLPPKPDFFPPANGWIFLFFLLLLIGIIIVFYIKRKQNPYIYALSELSDLYKKNPNDLMFAKEVSKLLKRLVLFKNGTEKAASLSQEKWSRFLQKSVPGILTQEEANFIAFSSYLPDNASEKISTKKLYPKVKQWIAGFKKMKAGS